MPAAGHPRAVSSTWQVRKPDGFGITISRIRIHAILCTWARASVSSTATKLRTRRSKEDRMTPLFALRTARMKGKPKRVLYSSFSSVKRVISAAVSESRPARFCSSVDSAVRAPATAALPARSGCAFSSASFSSSEAPSTVARIAAASAESEPYGPPACARSATQGEDS